MVISSALNRTNMGVLLHSWDAVEGVASSLPTSATALWMLPSEVETRITTVGMPTLELALHFHCSSFAHASSQLRACLLGGPELGVRSIRSERLRPLPQAPAAPAPGPGIGSKAAFDEGLV